MNQNLKNREHILSPTEPERTFCGYKTSIPGIVLAKYAFESNCKQCINRSKKYYEKSK